MSSSYTFAGSSNGTITLCALRDFSFRGVIDVSV